MRFLIKSDYVIALRIVKGVFRSQRVSGIPGVLRVPRGKGVLKTTSSFDITLSGSKGTNLDPLNPSLTLFSVIKI
jgi:hypothetical protein